MSLQGIFDPLVRNWFKENLEGNGGESAAGIKVATYSPYIPRSYDILELDDRAYIKISNETPTLNELIDSIFAILYDGEGTCEVLVESNIDAFVDETEVGVLIKQCILIMSEETAAAVGFPSGGMWVESLFSKSVLGVSLVWGI